MSTLKFINGKNQHPEELRRILDYIGDIGKNPMHLYHTWGVSRNNQYRDMKLIKALHGKIDGRQFIHFVLSFDQDCDETAAYEVASDAVGWFEGEYQVAMACHTNTRNFHAHYILNSVGVSGRKYSQGPGDLYKFRDYINSLLDRRGLPPILKVVEAGFDEMDADEWDYEGFLEGFDVVEGLAEEYTDDYEYEDDENDEYNDEYIAAQKVICKAMAEEVMAAQSPDEDGLIMPMGYVPIGFVPEALHGTEVLKIYEKNLRKNAEIEIRKLLNSRRCD